MKQGYTTNGLTGTYADVETLANVYASGMEHSQAETITIQQDGSPNGSIKIYTPANEMGLVHWHWV